MHHPVLVRLSLLAGFALAAAVALDDASLAWAFPPEPSNIAALSLSLFGFAAGRRWHPRAKGLMPATVPAPP